MVVADLAAGSHNVRVQYRSPGRARFANNLSSWQSRYLVAVTVPECTTPDTVKPTITCPSPRTVNTATSQAYAIQTYTASASDNSGSVSVVYNPVSGSRFSIGQTTVQATATDPSGNSASCTFSITVVDAEKPTVTCPGAVSTTTTLDKATGVATWSPATASDNSGSAPSLASSHSSGSAFAIGSTTVTYTAKDAAGNAATCSFAVTVRDAQAPKVFCPNDVTTTSLTDGKAVSFVSATATDNSGATPSLSASPSSGSFFSLGTTTVTYTARDAAGNAATCTFKVSVADNQAPIIACPNDISAVVPHNTKVAKVTWDAPSASDSSGVKPSVTVSKQSGAEFPIGTTVVTATATDAAGNTARCTFQLFVLDQQVPTISCPASRTVSAAEDTHTATLTLLSATATDNSGSANVNCDRINSVTLAIGTHQVTCTATDASANKASCSYMVLVEDIHAPKLTCPENQKAVADVGSKGTAVTYAAPTATDNSLDDLSVKCSAASGATFTIGTTAVLCSAQDTAGNKGMSQYISFFCHGRGYR